MNYPFPDVRHLQRQQRLEYDVSNNTLSRPTPRHIFIPELCLAFEYNGFQHYHATSIFGSLSEQQRRDQFKRVMSHTAGVTLIEIPYYWNQERESLAATIIKYRPDITFHGVSSNATPISLQIPPIMTQTVPLFRICTAEEYTNQECRRWQIGALPAGIRVLWTGKQILDAKYGVPIPTPASFTFTWPNLAIEGIIRSLSSSSSPSQIDWRSAEMVALDAPLLESPLHARLQLLSQCIRCNHHGIIYTGVPSQNPTIKFVSTVEFPGRDSIRAVSRMCPDGLRVLNPHSYYHDESSRLELHKYTSVDMLATEQRNSYVQCTAYVIKGCVTRVELMVPYLDAKPTLFYPRVK